MVCLQDRYFDDDVALAAKSELVKKADATPDISVHFYRDFIFYYATILVKGKAILREFFLNDCDQYLKDLKQNVAYQTFFIEYAASLPTPKVKKTAKK